jgi:hypothetical protein
MFKNTSKAVINVKGVKTPERNRDTLLTKTLGTHFDLIGPYTIRTKYEKELTYMRSQRVIQQLTGLK